MRKHLIFCIFIILFSSQYAQEGEGKHSFDYAIEDPYLKFDHLTKKDGLSNNFILDILQDHYGFMWIATMNGLNRYDGHRFLQFHHLPNDTTSISSNHINCLEEDNNGVLWIGTNKGLSRYNRKTNLFETIYLNKAKQYHVRALFSDTNNILWIEIARGELLKYNIQKKTLLKYKHHKPSMANTYFYHTIYRDKQGVLWLGGRFMGIYSFNPKTEQFRYYKEDENNPNKKRERDVSTYFQDSQGQMWIGGVDGLYKFDTHTEIFHKQCPVSTFSIEEDENKNLWIGTGGGIYLHNIQDNTTFYMKKDDNNPMSLIHDNANVIYIDQTQNVWIGTSSGISIYKPSKSKFKHIFHIVGDPKTPSSSSTLSLLQLSDGEIWIGTEKKGIQCVNQNFLTTRQFQHQENNPNSLNSNKISVLMQDTDNDVWAGQWTGRGFNIINPSTERVKSFALVSNSLNADWYNDILQDHKGEYWMALWGAQGIHQFDKKRSVFNDITFRLLSQFDNIAIKKLIA